MNVGAWLVAIKQFLVVWHFLTVMVLVLAGLAALALWLTRGMWDPNRDKELERLMARARDTLGEDAMDEAMLAVGERAARDGWDVYRPGGHLNPAFARPFAEEVKKVKKELLRRLRQRKANDREG